MTAIVPAPRTEAIGAIVLKAAGALTASTAGTAVTLDRTQFDVDINWSAIDISSTDELYLVTIEANTQAAPTVWTVIAHAMCIGATAKVASSGDATATGQMRLGVDNPYDYQVRIHTWISGTTPSINFTANAYPIKNISYIG